jgi:hypothetical protein
MFKFKQQAVKSIRQSAANFGRGLMLIAAFIILSEVIVIVLKTSGICVPQDSMCGYIHFIHRYSLVNQRDWKEMTSVE